MAIVQTLPLCLALLSATAAPETPKMRLGVDLGERISILNVHQLRVVSEVERRVFRMEWGPGQGVITLLEFGKGIEIAKANDFQIQAKLDTTAPSTLAANPNGHRIAWSDSRGKTVFVKDLKSGKTVEIPTEGTSASPAFNPDQTRIAIGETVTTNPQREGSGISFVKIYKVNGEFERKLDVSQKGYGALRPVFSHDGKLLLVGNRNYETTLFDAETGNLLQTFPRRMTQEVAFSPDDKTVAAGYVDGAVALWDVQTGKQFHERPSGANEIYTVSWSPKGDLLATAGRLGKITLWNPGTMEKVKEFGAPDWVIQVRFSPDGTKLLTAGGDEWGRKDPKIQVWSIPKKVPKD